MLSSKNRVSRLLFQEIVKGGRSRKGTYFSFRTLRHPAQDTHLAIAVPGRISRKPVIRNALRRRGYGALRVALGKHAPAVTGVFFATKDYTHIPHDVLVSDMKTLLGLRTDK
jgi:ribonuclease P protein component